MIMLSFRAPSLRIIIARTTPRARLPQPQQKRGMALGGHHGPPPDWQGVDKVVRGVFPHDYQLAIAILSGYVGIGVLYKIGSAMGGGSSKHKNESTTPSSSLTASQGVPAIDSPQFEKFVESEAFEKLLENEDQLTKLIENA